MSGGGRTSAADADADAWARGSRDGGDRPVPAKMMSRTMMLVLALVTAGNWLNQMDRFLPVFLSAVVVPHCSSDCDDARYVALCDSCGSQDDDDDDDDDDVSDCLKCQDCRRENDGKFYNMLDGSCISTVEYGILVGVAFSSVFCLASPLAGRLADSLPVHVLNAVSLAVFSASMVALGSSKSFVAALFCRFVLAAAQAFNAPCSYTTLTNFFPEEKRNLGNSVYNFGSYAGDSAGSLAILVAVAVGWRWVCRAVGIFGLFLSVPIYLFTAKPDGGGPLTEPPLSQLEDGPGVPATDRQRSRSRSRSHSDDGDAQPGSAGATVINQPLLHGPPPADLDDTLPVEAEVDAKRLDEITGHVHHHSDQDADADTDSDSDVGEGLQLDTRAALRMVLGDRIVVLLLVSSAFRFMAGFAIGNYSAIYFSRAFGSDIGVYSVVNAIVITVSGISSAYLGGWLSDRWTAPSETHPWGRPGAPAFVSGTGGVLAILPSAIMYFSPSLAVALIGLFLEYLFAECWLGPVITAIQSLLPVHVHGLAVSCYMATILVGNLSPTIIGALDPGDSSVRLVLFLVVAISYAISGILFNIAAIRMNARAKNRFERNSDLITAASPRLPSKKDHGAAGDLGPDNRPVPDAAAQDPAEFETPPLSPHR